MKYPHNTDVYISFYNDRILEVIAATDITEPFTYVPIKAGHMEVVGGNVMVFGDMTEGYPPQAVDCHVEFASESLVGIGTNISLNLRPWREPQSELGEYKWYLRVEIPQTVFPGSTYIITIGDKTASYVAQPGDTAPIITLALIVLLTSAGIRIHNNPQGLSGIFMEQESQVALHYDQNLNEWILPGPQPYLNWTYSAKISTLIYGNSTTQLKRGSKHGFGVAYKDDFGRQNSVTKDDELIINIPFYDEVIYYGEAIGADFMYSDLDSKINPVFKIYSTPPDWAKSYEIVYCGNLSMDMWLQIKASSITNMGNSRYKLDIQSKIDEIRAANTRWKVPNWEWVDGDRIRLICTINDSNGALTKYDSLYDYSIESVYDSVIGGDFLFQAVNKPAGLVNALSNIFVEIYRPKKGMGTSVFYGTGMVFEVGVDINGKKYHKGDIDQVLDAGGVTVIPAQIVNTAFDSWKFLRTNYKIGDTSSIRAFWAESNLPSDFWADQLIVNRITSMGFPFLYDISQKQSTLTKRLRHGGYLLPGTQVNEIAHFTYADFIDMGEKDGDITGLREIGFTLKVLQLHKETSIYINRIQTFNPDGTEQFTLIDRLLGTARPEETSFGCQHPDSILVEGRNLYYWDNIEGEVVRSSPNGQVALSGPEYKMSRWFKDLVSWVRTNGGAQKLKVRFGYNVSHDELWCTYIIDDTVYGVIFSEAQKRWITRIDLITDAYVHAGEFFAHLYNQKMWVMNVDEGQDYLSWTGVEKNAEIEFVSNIDPKKNKVFNAIAVYSDHEMEIPEGCVRIPLEAASALMESFVALWEEAEGIFYGAILKDVNTPGVWVSDDDVAMNGREMRGRYCFVRMKTSEHDEKVRLDSVIVFSTPSERNV